MSSLFDVPAGLLFVLSLAATNPGPVETAATGISSPRASASAQIANTSCRYDEQAWFAVIKDGAGGAAFAPYAARIFQTSNGRFYVPVEDERRKLLALSRDHAASCFIALSSAARNAHRLAGHLGRKATLTDLYLAHALGLDGAVKILTALSSKPKQRLSKLFPELKRNTPGIFSGRGKEMTIAGFVSRLERVILSRVQRHGNKSVIATANGPSRDKARASAAASENGTGKALPMASPVAAALTARDLLSAGLVNGIAGTAAQQKMRLPNDLSRFDFAKGLTDLADTLQMRRARDILERGVTTPGVATEAQL